MLTIMLFTVIVFPVAMLITAKGIEKKEKSSIECALSEYCEIEKAKNCSQEKETSINYLTMNVNDALLISTNKEKK